MKVVLGTSRRYSCRHCHNGDLEMTSKIAIPVDWYMTGDGLKPRNDTRWVEVLLHPDGSVTWGTPVVIPGGMISIK